MANTILRLKHHRKAFHALGLFSLLLVMQRVGATEFNVGGGGGWTVPTNPNMNTYNQWAESKRFQIGDSLVFDYQADKDSVLQVNKEDYDSCNSKSPIASFKDGHTVITFNTNGPHYFISGVPENCKKNEKIVIVVMADRSNRSSNTASPPSPSASSPSPSVSPPSPSGYIENAPAPSPGTEIAPSTPSVESPTPAPSGTSSMFVNAIASVAAFAGSSLLLVL